MEQTHVLIIGGGFGGVYAARTLLQKGHRVTLINKTNFFVFTPLLHEVATGSLNANDITFEYSSFFENPSFTFYRETVTETHFDERCIVTSDGERVSYDYLIFSTGAETNFFGIQGREHTFELKSIEDASRLKGRVVALAQGIEREATINIVGGGPTGVELTFEIDEFLREIQKHSPTLDYTVRLIHAGESLCGMFPKSIQEYALGLMKEEEVDVRLGTTVSEVREDCLITKTGEYIKSDLTVWTAGVMPSTNIIDAQYKDARGNILVEESLRIKGLEREFAVGDAMTFESKAIPKLAQTALKQGIVVAKNIDALVRGKEMKAYNPKTQGALISLGKGRGAGILFGVTFRGFIGWSIWRNAYLSKVPGFRNKYEVITTWFINLFSSRDLFER